MQTQAQAFRRILEKLIKTEIDRETEVITAGKVADFAEYKLKAGRIAGFVRVLDLCGDAETEMNKINS